MIRRWEGALGNAVRRYGDIIWSGVPNSALMGLSANSTGATENTTDAVANQSFHEIGYYQIPAGPRDGPAPNPNPNAHDNAWGQLATSTLVRQVLGRPATMVHNAWKTAIDDQTAVGLANYLRDGTTCTRLLHWDLPVNSLAFWCVSILAYGVGATGAQRIITAYDVVPGDEFIWNLAYQIATTTHNTYHAKRVVRCLQRYYTGLLLSQHISERTAWYGAQHDDLADTITRVSNGTSPRGDLSAPVAQLPNDPAMDRDSWVSDILTMAASIAVITRK